MSGLKIFIIIAIVIALIAGGLFGTRYYFKSKEQPGTNSTSSAPVATSSAEKVITLANNNQTITLNVGDEFLLQLGESYNWRAEVDRQDILGLKIGVLVVRGAQGIYQANTPGTATLTALGEPPCYQETPSCSLPSVDFRLTVIVQGSISQPAWQPYDNAEYGFSLKYPQDIATIKLGNGQPSYDWESFTDIQGIKIAQVYIPKEFEPNTNFSEAWVNIGQSSDGKAVANCLNPYPDSGDSQATSSAKEINGINFSVSSGSDQGAGNIYKFTGYRVVRVNQCFAISLVVHYNNIQNYPPGTVAKLDYNKVYSLLEEILETFTFSR